MQSYLRGAAFILAASLAGTAIAAESTDNSKLAHHDRSFIEKAAKGGMKEVAVSQAVMGNLTNPSVRDFATTMVTDHTAADAELSKLAMAKGVALNAEHNDKMTAKLNEKWSAKDGNVDKKYIKEMVEDHEDAVKLFTKATKSDDADIAAFAQKTLPTLQHHLMMAQDLKKTLSM
ncbi:MAG: DUF4142 domain-containing protein [Opitutaceae bacterium]